MNFVSTSDENLIKPTSKIENKIDFSLLRNIKEVSIETGIDWESVNMCNLSFKYNVNEICRGEKGLFLFRIEDLTEFWSKNMICCQNLKKFQLRLDSPNLKNNAFDFNPSLMIKKTDDINWNCFAFENIFEIYQKFGEEEKMFSVISYTKKCNYFEFYLGERQNSMKYKVIGEFSNFKNNCFKLCNLYSCKPNPVKFDIILPLAIEINVGSLIKHYRSSFEDLDKEKIVISFPPDALPHEKVWFICLGAIINLMLFGEND